MSLRFFDVHTHHLRYDPEILSIVCALPKKDDGKSLFSWGIHPCSITQPRQQKKELESVLEKDRWVAIGECGLDKLSPAPMALQIELFEAQIRLSEKLHKPLIIHCVKAWAELIAIRRQLSPLQPWIIHGFRGKKELADQLLREGLFLSFGQYYHNEALCSAWPEHLFLETDMSDCNIADLYQKAAQVLQQTQVALQQQVLENCSRVGLV